MHRLVVLAAFAALLALPASASALTVSKAELRNGQLRIEGSGASPGIFVIASSSTSNAGARSDTGGAFKISASGFNAPDCTATVSDGRTPIATARLSGCTPAPVTPPPAANPPPSGSCVIDPGAPGSFHVGDASAYFFTTTGCTGGPLEWSLVAGAVPTGMGSPIFQGQTAGAITGTPTTEGTYTFTVKALDAAGQTDTETFTVTVTPPRPLSITTAAALPAATAGRAYDVILAADGGLPGYLWTLRSGTLPPGLRLSSNHIAGTPTARGTSTFVIRVSDSRGTVTDKTLSITVG